MNAGFLDKVYAFCEGASCKNRGVEAQVLDSSKNLYCRSCSRNVGMSWAISTFLDVTPENILRKLELDRVKKDKITEINKHETRILNQLKTKMEEYRKCIEALQPSSYFELIKKLNAAKHKIADKTKAEVKGEDIHQLKVVCDEFDTMVANKEESQEIKNIQKVINSVQQLELKIQDQLTDLLHFLPIPGQTVRLIYGTSWQAVAAEIEKIDAPVKQLRLCNEYPHSELLTKSFDKVIKALDGKKDRLTSISFHFNRDFKLNVAETEVLKPLLAMGKQVAFLNRIKMIEVNDYKCDFKDVGPAFEKVYHENRPMPYKGLEEK